MKDFESSTNARTRTRDVVLISPRLALLEIITALTFLGFHLLFYFRGGWFPFWVKISVTIVFLLVFVAFAAHFTISVSKKDLPPLREVAFTFKPYILWASIALMILCWVIALIKYNSLWFYVAFGSTLLVFVIGFFSLRALVQQIESTETDIV